MLTIQHWGPSSDTATSGTERTPIIHGTTIHGQGPQVLFPPALRWAEMECSAPEALVDALMKTVQKLRAHGLEDIPNWYYPDRERQPPDHYCPKDWWA